ncbi:glutathione S-transferase family protein [Brevundimonas sp.]|uniref:glutathione S-transferase family protein n=1 Tax=Brevundimonas sp. TaxID=1871086 RepID=UPI0027310C6E|nr:glutathione S-transferase family protein [Brevundimonas sp.]MDP1912338.1 glutathione S-transferase family protein [Brevundimonas sp.]
MKLYYFDVLNPRKVCALARYLNLPVEFVHVDLGKGEHKTPAFLAMNPNAKVPVLVDGNTTLWESNAILCYLARKAGSDLWPTDARQFEVLRWLMWDATEFAPQTGTLYFEHIIKSRFGIGGPDPAEVQQATQGFLRFAAVLDAHLRGRRYLVGDALSVADFAVAISLPYAQQAQLPLQDFPEIRRWHAQMNALPAWREPFPERAEPAALAEAA